MSSVVDIDSMQRALELASRARLHCPPNPAVGCVLVSSSGNILGEGCTQPVGHAHAEIMALRDAAARGESVVGATAYVTLEPCSHQGRTGPCCDALIAAGIAKVVASLVDPNPRVSGQGFSRLRAAGIEVLVGPGADISRELNQGFFSRMQRGTPWVRLKVASSMDGRTALPNGRSQWITSPAARADGHRWRARADAVLSGIGTVLHDDPQLNVRLPGVTRAPMLVLVDSSLRTPVTARLWNVPDRNVLIYTASRNPQRAQALMGLGAELVVLPKSDRGVDLGSLLRDLGHREVNEVHIEAGEKLNGSFLREGLVDELLLYLSPKLLGQGPGVAQFPASEQVEDVPSWHWHDLQPVGADLRLMARRK